MDAAPPPPHDLPPGIPGPEGATPAMAQWFVAKAAHPDALVFFRMGDFFELFFDDAKIASACLDIALTARGEHEGERIPMCGVPVHAMEGYLARLIKAGHRVAIAEQLATENGRNDSTFEFQMLYGIRPEEQRRLVAAGHTVRVYVPFGTDWYGYFTRRLAERPANLLFFLRSLVTRK